MTAIIVLNWNGASDTLACLDSLSQAMGKFVVFVVDNGSTDDSLVRIQSWIDGHAGIDVRLVPFDENYGFARGNNKGLKVALKGNFDSYLLLNNDTEVCPDFLIRLESFSKEHPEYRVLTPKINFFYDKQKIWNCGGKLFFGFRKYYYAGEPNEAVREAGHIPITFVTGCALFFYPELLDEQGYLLTERFFFGEEDFEFSLRMKGLGIRMACVLDSKIYHKVGASGNKMNHLGKLYMHYLNRFVDVKLHMSPMKYTLWKFLNLPIVARYFYRTTKKVGVTIRLIRSLWSNAKRKDGVSQEDFNHLVLENNYFSFEV